MESEQHFWTYLHQVITLAAYAFTHRFDVISTSGPYLDSNKSTVDEKVGYIFTRAKYPSESKRGAVCICYNYYLIYRLLDIYNLQKCINFKIIFLDKQCNYISLYRSPRRFHDVFEKLADNFQLNLDKIAIKKINLTVILGNFNAYSFNWHTHDRTTYQDSKIDTIMYHFGLQQLI